MKSYRFKRAIAAALIAGQLFYATPAFSSKGSASGEDIWKEIKRIKDNTKEGIYVSSAQISKTEEINKITEKIKKEVKELMREIENKGYTGSKNDYMFMTANIEKQNRMHLLSKKIEKIEKIEEIKDKVSKDEKDFIKNKYKTYTSTENYAGLRLLYSYVRILEYSKENKNTELEELCNSLPETMNNIRSEMNQQVSLPSLASELNESIEKNKSNQIILTKMNAFANALKNSEEKLDLDRYKYLKGIYTLAGGTNYDFAQFLNDLEKIIERSSGNAAEIISELNNTVYNYTIDLFNFMHTGNVGKYYMRLIDYRTNFGLEKYVDRFIVESLKYINYTETLSLKSMYESYKKNNAADVYGFLTIFGDNIQLRSKIKSTGDIEYDYKTHADYVKKIDGFLKNCTKNDSDYKLLYLTLIGEEYSKDNFGYLVLNGNEKKAKELMAHINNSMLTFKDMYVTGINNSDVPDLLKKELVTRSLEFFNTNYFDAKHITAALMLSFGKGVFTEGKFSTSEGSNLFVETINTLYAMKKIHWSLLPSYITKVHLPIIAKTSNAADAALLLRVYRDNINKRGITDTTFQNVEYIGMVMSAVYKRLNAVKYGFNRFEIADMLAVENVRTTPMEDISLTVEHTPLLKAVSEFGNFSPMFWAVWRLAIRGGEDYKLPSLISDQLVKGQFVMKYDAETLMNKARGELSPKYGMYQIDPQVNVGFDPNLLIIAINGAFVEQEIKFAEKLYFRGGAFGGATDAEQVSGTEIGGGMEWRGYPDASAYLGAAGKTNKNYNKRYIIRDGRLEEVKEEQPPTTSSLISEGRISRFGKENKGIITGGESLQVSYTENVWKDIQSLTDAALRNALERKSDTLVFIRYRGIAQGTYEEGEQKLGPMAHGEVIRIYHVRSDGTVSEIHFSKPVEEYLKRYMGLRADITELRLLAIGKTIPADFSNFKAEAVIFDLNMLKRTFATGEIYREISKNATKKELEEYYRNINNIFERVFRKEFGFGIGEEILDNSALAFMYSGYTPLKEPVLQGKDKYYAEGEAKHFLRTQYFWYRGGGTEGRATVYGIGSNTGYFGGVETAFPSPWWIFRKSTAELTAGKYTSAEKLAVILSRGDNITNYIDWFVNSSMSAEVNENYKAIMKLILLKQTIEAVLGEEKVKDTSTAAATYLLAKFKKINVGALYQNSLVFEKLRQLEEAYRNEREMIDKTKGQSIVTDKSVQQRYDELKELITQNSQRAAIFLNVGNRVMVVGSMDFGKSISELQQGGTQIIGYITDDIYVGTSSKVTVIDKQTGAIIDIVASVGSDGRLRLDGGIKLHSPIRDESVVAGALGRVLLAYGQAIYSLSAGYLKNIKDKGAKATAELYGGWRDNEGKTHYLTINAAQTSEHTKVKSEEGEKESGGISIIAGYGLKKSHTEGNYWTFGVDGIVAGPTVWIKNNIKDTLGFQLVSAYGTKGLVENTKIDASFGFLPPGTIPEPTSMYNINLADFISRFLYFYINISMQKTENR